MEELLAKWGVSSSAEISKISDGLINGSWKINTTSTSFILQRINADVFPNPTDLMTNHQIITKHIDSKSFPYRYPEWLNGEQNEKLIFFDNDHWRLGNYYSDTYAPDKVSDADAAWKVGQAFGTFDAVLADLSPTQLKDTIIEFHNLDRYLERLKSTLLTASDQRKQIAKSLLKEVDDFLYLNKLIFEKNRVIHNDAKISNLLFQDAEVHAVIDWDTTMGGHISWEYADLFRSTGINVAEDHPEVQDMELQFELIEGLTAGYKSMIFDHLSDDERSSLYHGAVYLIFEQAVRFLEDYLAGDVYYKCDYDDHNFIRARNQFHLLSLLERDKKKVKVCIQAS